MPTRRSLLIGVAAALSAPSLAHALDLQDYDAARVQAAMASGQPVVLHVYATWCLQCHMQKSILDELKAADEYKTLAIFRVDYDNQKDVVAMLDCPRATVIAYKGGKEVKRMSWGMTQASVEEVLKAAL